MRKFLSILLGLSLLTGSVVLTYAQEKGGDTPKEGEGKKKGKKKKKKDGDTEDKKG